MMFGLLRAFRVAKSIIRERIKCRSPRWNHVRKMWLMTHPTCAACGGKRLLQVHHVEPYHLDQSKELDFGNFITLCVGRYECHIRLGHGNDFKSYNPFVRRDAAVVLANPDERKRVEAMAVAARKYAA